MTAVGALAANSARPRKATVATVSPMRGNTLTWPVCVTRRPVIAADTTCASVIGSSSAPDAPMPMPRPSCRYSGV